MPVTPFRSLRFVLALSLVAVLVACKPAPLEVRTYSSDAAFAINAHLLVGEREAVLIDTGFYRSDAEQIVELIRSTGRELRYIVYTHAHPDHYFGADIIRDAFPGVPVEATLGVYLDFQANAQATYNAYKAQLGNQIADRLIAPFLLPSDGTGYRIEFEGHTLRLLEQPQAGESKGAAVVEVDSPRVHLAGDVLYNNVHLVLAECQPSGWKQDIEWLRSLNPTTIYPGHGPVAQGTAALDAARDYIDAAVPILDAAATADEAKTTLAGRFPNYAGSGLLDFSVTQYFSRCRR
jgi:glyoxylase-like metal-dependent hydrolase (beta-lactamase superfamily II)